MEPKWPVAMLAAARKQGSRSPSHSPPSHAVSSSGVFMSHLRDFIFLLSCFMAWTWINFQTILPFSLVSARPLLWTWPTMGRAARQHSWFRKVQGHRGRWGQDSPHSLNCREIYTSYWAMELPTSLTPSACIPHHPHCLSTQASMHLHSGSW